MTDESKVLELYILDSNRFLELYSKQARGEKLTADETTELFRHNHAVSELERRYLKQIAERSENAAADVSELLSREKTRDQEGKTFNADSLSLKEVEKQLSEVKTVIRENQKQPVNLSYDSLFQGFALLGLCLIVANFALNKLFGGSY